MAAFNDTFDRVDSATVGNGWDESESPGEWQILGNKCRATTGAGNFASTQLKRPAGEAFENGIVEVEYQPVTDTQGMAQVWGRMQGVSDNTGYVLYVLVGRLNLSKSVGGALTTLNVVTGLTITPGVNYKLKLTMNGSLIEGFLHNLDTSALVATVSVTNTDVVGSGAQALSIDTIGPPGTIDYDNFNAVEAVITKTVIFSDPFTRANSPTPGNGWVEETSTVYEILSNKLRCTPDAGGFSVNRCFRPIGENLVDAMLSVDFQFVVGQGTSSIPGIEWRMQGAGDLNGYSVLIINSTTMAISRIDTAISVITLASVTFTALTEGVNYQMVADISGNSFTATLKNLDTTTTIAVTIATDGTYPGAGKTGVACNTGGQVDFDNYEISVTATAASTTLLDDFNRVDSITVGNSWTEQRLTAWQILTNKLRFTGDGSTAFTSNRLFRPVGENFADGIVQADFQFQTTPTTTFFDIQGRLQGVGELDGYIIFNSGDANFSLGRMDGGALTTLASAVIPTFVIGTNYQAKLEMTGSTFVATLTNLDTSAVITTLNATDFTYLSDGRSAYSGNTTGIVDFDNAVIGLGPIVAVVLNPGDLGLLERFNTTLASWVLDTAGGTAFILDLDNSPKLQLIDTSATLNVKATRDLNLIIATQYIIEVDMYCVSGAVGYLELLSSFDVVLATIKNDGSINQGSFSTDTEAASTFTWPALEYKMIVLSVDPVANTISAWYTTGTGNPVSNWVQIGLVKAFSGSTGSKIRFRTDNTAQGEFRVDEVKVYMPKIFCFGDSNTAGFSGLERWSPIPNSTDRTGTAEVETHSYPLKLGQQYTPQAWCVNRGISGDRTDHIDVRVQADVIDQGAVVCVVLIGTNDIIELIPEATIKANILSVRDKLLAAGIKVVLCTIPPVDNWVTAQNTKRNNLNAFIATLKVGNSVKVADVYLAVRNPSLPDKRLPAYADTTNEHFNEAGLQVIADAIFTIEQTVFSGNGAAIYYWMSKGEE